MDHVELVQFRKNKDFIIKSIWPLIVQLITISTNKSMTKAINGLKLFSKAYTDKNNLCQNFQDFYINKWAYKNCITYTKYWFLQRVDMLVFVVSDFLSCRSQQDKTSKTSFCHFWGFQHLVMYFMISTTIILFSKMHISFTWAKYSFEPTKPSHSLW